MIGSRAQRNLYLATCTRRPVMGASSLARISNMLLVQWSLAGRAIPAALTPARFSAFTGLV
jgi:hypothetical protein